MKTSPSKQSDGSNSWAIAGFEMNQLMVFLALSLAAVGVMASSDATPGANDQKVVPLSEAGEKSDSSSHTGATEAPKPTHHASQIPGSNSQADEIIISIDGPISPSAAIKLIIN
jgi:hypothetical protein